ncbi:MAG: hypothetical protein JXA14_10040 [Anaerolineae bacterium]|nr:hypothetical protein [Anaerolineae bacterium]
MVPVVYGGDILVVEEADAASLRRGDIVVCYFPGGGAIAHRVVKRVYQAGSVCFVLRGDATAHADEPVVAEQLLGRVVAVEHNGRTLHLSRPLPRLFFRYVKLRWWLRSAVRFVTRKVKRRLVFSKAG